MNIKQEIYVAAKLINFDPMYYYRSLILEIAKGMTLFCYGTSIILRFPSFCICIVLVCFNPSLNPQGLCILLISSVFNAADSADDSNDSDDEFQICQICSGEDVLCFNLDSLISFEVTRI